MNEVAINTLKDILEEATETEYSISYVTSVDTDALKEAIQALEQQPCEDCVKREPIQKAIKDMLRWINSGNRGNADYFIVDQIEEIIAELDIDNLPSVTPLRPRGKWILIHPLQEDDDGAYICSNCEHGDWDCDTSYKYCPFCGADMRESEEEE